MRMDKKLILLLFAAVLLLTNCNSTNDKGGVSNIYTEGINKLEYNNPEALVDLDGGFKVLPMPMDFDGDGDYDLVLSESGAYAEAGIFYFENISGNVEMPVFRRGAKISYDRRRLGSDGANFEVSVINKHVHVLTPDRVGERLLIYKDVPQNVFWDDNEIKLPEKGYDILHFHKNTQWKIIDFDGDGAQDLVCSAFGARSSQLRGAGSNEREKRYAGISRHNQLVFLKNRGDNDNPVYENPIEILKENGEPLAKGVAIKPMFADYDNDGDLDFIGIGEAQNGEHFDVRWEKNFFIYFENTGTKTSYKFGVGKVLVNNNLPVQMESRATIHTTAIDWDKDGFIDIIAGDEGGRVALLKNSGKIINGIPQFLPPRNFQQKAKYVDFGALTTPRIFDWDGDGLDDIISGNGIGNIGFFKNLGGDVPKWDAPKYLTFGGQQRIIPDKALPNTEEPKWGYTTIDVGFWDDDNLPDILVNDHNGNVVWLKNIGSRKDPKLAPPEPIKVEWDGNPQKPAWTPGTVADNKELLAPWRTSPFIMDFNSDGLNDLVILDYEGYLAVYPRFRKEGKLYLKPPERNFVYPTGEPVLLNQRTGSSSGRLKITFADWDGDGLKDLIFASKPAVDWMKNLGMKEGKMVLQYMGRVVSRTLMGHTAGPVVSDFNKDGVPDLLVGTEIGVFFYWQRTNFDVTTTMTTSGKQTPANYQYFKR